MTEIDALIKIAEAIEHLASVINNTGFALGLYLALFLIFKKMG